MDALFPQQLPEFRELVTAGVVDAERTASYLVVAKDDIAMHVPVFRRIGVFIGDKAGELAIRAAIVVILRGPLDISPGFESRRLAVGARHTANNGPVFVRFPARGAETGPVARGQQANKEVVGAIYRALGQFLPLGIALGIPPVIALQRHVGIVGVAGMDMQVAE